MKHSIPFPNGGGDWRFDPRTGALVDASAPVAEPAAPAPPKASGDKPAATTRKRTARKS